MFKGTKAVIQVFNLLCILLKRHKIFLFLIHLIGSFVSLNDLGDCPNTDNKKQEKNNRIKSNNSRGVTDLFPGNDIYNKKAENEQEIQSDKKDVLFRQQRNLHV